MKKGVEAINLIVKLIIVVAIIIIAFMFIKNIDVIKEGIDKLLNSIASFK